MNVLLCIVKLLNCWHGQPTSVQRISWQSIYFEKKWNTNYYWVKENLLWEGSPKITGCSLNGFPVFCKIYFLSYLGSTKYPLPPSKVDFFSYFVTFSQDLLDHNMSATLQKWVEKCNLWLRISFYLFEENSGMENWLVLAVTRESEW